MYVAQALHIKSYNLHIKLQKNTLILVAISNTAKPINMVTCLRKIQLSGHSVGPQHVYGQMVKLRKKEILLHIGA